MRKYVERVISEREERAKRNCQEQEEEEEEIGRMIKVIKK